MHHHCVVPGRQPCPHARLVSVLHRSSTSTSLTWVVYACSRHSCLLKKRTFFKIEMRKTTHEWTGCRVRKSASCSCLSRLAAAIDSPQSLKMTPQVLGHLPRHGDSIVEVNGARGSSQAVRGVSTCSQYSESAHPIVFRFNMCAAVPVTRHWKAGPLQDY